MSAESFVHPGSDSAGALLRLHGARALDLATAPLLDSAEAEALLKRLIPVLGVPVPATGHHLRTNLVAAAESLLARRDAQADSVRLESRSLELTLVAQLVSLLSIAAPDDAVDCVRRAFSGRLDDQDLLAQDIVAYADAPLELLGDAHVLVRIAAVGRRLAGRDPQAGRVGARLLGLDEESLGSLSQTIAEADDVADVNATAQAPSAAALARRIDRYRQVEDALAVLSEVEDRSAAGARLEALGNLLGAPLLPLWLDRDDSLVILGSGDLAGQRLSTRDTKSLAASALAEGRLLQRDTEGSGVPVIDRQCARRLDTVLLRAVPMLAPDSIGVLLAPAVVAEDDLKLVAVHAARWLARVQRSEQQLAAAAGNYRSAHERRLREIVHEANNPLSVIQNYLHLLGTRLDSDDGSRENLRLIGDEIQRAGNILRTLVEVPATVAARRSLELARQADLAQVIGEVLELLEPTLMDEAGITTRLDLPANIGLLPVDPQRLRQILLNLLKNAAEAMPNGGVLEVEVDPSVVDASGSRVEIRITDTGGGIAPEVLAKLFEPGSSSKGKGRGLGLGIVRRLVDEVGGNILCRSRPGEGTTFIVLLPRG